MAASPSKTDYASQSTFFLDRENDDRVSFIFNADPTRPEMTKMVLPEGSIWTPQPHWHEHYDELIEVKKGRVLFIIDGKETIATSADGPQKIPRFAIHDWMRADARLPADQKDQGEVVVEEWTVPGDKMHQVFFRNLIGTVYDSKSYWKTWTPLQMMLILYTYDNWPALSMSLPKVVNYAAAHAQLTTLAHSARVLRLKPWYEEYTPVDMRELAAKGVVKALI